MATKSEDPNYLYLIVGLTPFILLCIRRVCTRWDRKNDEVYEALRSPSVRDARNAFDRRVALAIREAKNGSQICAGCGFANSTRVAACVLCGHKMPPKVKGFRGALRAKAKGTAASDATLMGGMTSRQRRVRRRREWTRKLDAQGSVVWVHESAGQVVGYVLQTHVDEAEASPPAEEIAPAPVIEESDPPASTDEISIVVEQSPAPPERTITDVANDLSAEFDRMTVSFVDASTVKSSAIAFAPARADDEASGSAAGRKLETVTNAQLDFPAKLAQFITTMASVFYVANQRDEDNVPAVSRFIITRDSLHVESITALATMTPRRAPAAIRIDFTDEQGIDAGGVYREWFLLLNEALVSPSAGVFLCVDEKDQTFYLNPHSREILGEDHLAHFLAAGRLLGRALLDGNVTGFHLALPLLKIILGVPVSFDDLEYFDPETHKNLKWLLENDGVDMLGLDFTVVEKLPSGKVQVVELLPGGSEIDVTDDNKRHFVDRKLQYLLFESVSSQLFAFLRGIYEVVPAELLMIFDAEELDYVLSGSDEIDVDDWETHTLPSKSLALHPAYFNFWKILRELTNEERRRLLQFATGSTRVPPGGFSALTSNDGRLCLFGLNGVLPSTTYGYLHSHACFNRLDVPMHRDLKSLREAVHSAISSEAVGFTTL